MLALSTTKEGPAEWRRRTRILAAKVVLVILIQFWDVLEVGVLRDEGTFLERAFFVLKAVGFAESRDLVQELRLCNATQGVDDSAEIGQQGAVYAGRFPKVGPQDG